MSIQRFIIVLVVAISGCNGATAVSSSAPEAAADATTLAAVPENPAVVEIRYDEVATYQDLQLRWLKLEDSRCPTGVTCVWAGQIVATVEVSRGGSAPIEVKLMHAVKREPEFTRVQGYDMRLQGVDPYPKDGITPARGDYVLRIEIRKP